MEPKLTYVIASRNDDYSGGFSWVRLVQTLSVLKRNAPNAEIIVVDWGSITPLYETTKEINGVRHLHVPTEVTRNYNTPFNEVVALNAGIRRAKGHFTARLDQDTIPGPNWFRWIKGHELSNPSAYFSMRRDMPEGDSDINKQHPLWHADQGWDMTTSGFYYAAVGILLAPTSAWHATRGYYERLRYRNHMEHDLCTRFDRLCGLVNLSPLINADFFHQYHPEVRRSENEYRPPDEVSARLARGEYQNPEDWGLNWASEQIKEVIT